ncbi:hypothetical protein [Mycolicibacterium fortuitum]|uniref:hypothetical protein n=1 Tax=Mycolicibacterium fortuitum TaxID=1766 RepID=UPI0007EBC494|nr:hypothetical protein [Mycolicibacterium fortuitum]NOQ58446.1 hypothetical protein [Mycolicibacterium fortuitum]OBB25468.1 hypothetical protein A5763_18795 [Mycolicibacterium fortuitum]OBB46140.1 hypothetical protein A5754_09000 [Mycolicibacterium fortuitum]OBB71255.1 hypothetical protein A5755_15590 [Mycolicibacterium fortuitum]OBF85676.1 hypothetical protein A5751_09680 [Mycolicibacterium fortuitum]
MTNPDISLASPTAFDGVIEQLEAVKGSIPVAGLTSVLGATDGSPTSATVAAILADAQNQVAEIDSSIGSAIDEFRAIQSTVKGHDTAGQDGVLRA